jgi:ABC-type oligopeptide transport system substrate-binding subunit
MKRSALHALAALLAACALLPACGRGTDDGTTRELRRGNGSEPDSIDPQLARMEAAMTILRDCYEGLVSMAPDGRHVAGASKSPLHDRIALAVTAMWREHLGAEASLRSEDFRVLRPQSTRARRRSFAAVGSATTTTPIPSSRC